MARPLINTRFTAPESPQCPHCGGSDLRTHGSGNGKRRYHCHACRRHSYGGPAEDRRCPYCHGPCWKNGHAANGRQRYACTACKRTNTGLWPTAPRSPGGPFPHCVAFYLGPIATVNFMRYCQATGMSGAQAIRDILRRAARPPSALVATARRVYDRDGDLGHVVVAAGAPDPGPLRFTGERLSDARAAATGRRMRLSDGNSRHRTVAVDARVTVNLDDLSKEGLVRTMKSLDCSRQEAIRYLLTHMRPPAPDR